MSDLAQNELDDHEWAKLLKINEFALLPNMGDNANINMGKKVVNVFLQLARFALVTCQTLYILAYFACVNTNYTYLYDMSTIKHE